MNDAFAPTVTLDSILLTTTSLGSLDRTINPVIAVDPSTGLISARGTKSGDTRNKFQIYSLSLGFRVQSL